MKSFQLSITPSRRAAGRFIAEVRRAIQKALADEFRKSGVSQSDIARAIGVHRSVINREIRGVKDITLGRVAELAWALGRTPLIELRENHDAAGANVPTAYQIREESVSSTNDWPVFLPQQDLSPTEAA